MALKIKGLKRARFCTFQGSFLGPRYCGEPPTRGETDRCKAHADLICAVCGKRADRHCEDKFYKRCKCCGQAAVDHDCEATLCRRERCRAVHDMDMGHDTAEQIALGEEYHDRC